MLFTGARRSVAGMNISKTWLMVRELAQGGVLSRYTGIVPLITLGAGCTGGSFGFTGDGFDLGFDRVERSEPGVDFEALPMPRSPEPEALTPMGLCPDAACDVVQLEAGGDDLGAYGYTCARTSDGRLACWGLHDNRPRWIGGLDEVVDVSVSEFNTCALTRKGDVFCWDVSALGFDLLTQACTAETGCGALPSQRWVPFPLQLVDVETAGDRVCGLDADRHVHCRSLWPTDGLACGSDTCAGEEAALVPALLELAGTPVTQLAMAARLSCAQLEPGGVGCWGSGDRGQLGDGRFDDSDTLIPVRAVRAAEALAVSPFAACAVKRGQAHCWGLVGYGGPSGCSGKHEPGLCTGTPTVVPGLPPVTEVALGWAHACALDEQGGVHCWGGNRAGQLGDGGFEGHTMPSRVEGLPPMRLIAAGRLHTCASDGHDIFCWGDDEAGQLGRGSRDPFDCLSLGGTSYPCAPTPQPVLPIE